MTEPSQSASELQAFAEWVVSLDDPKNPESQIATWKQIVERARKALAS